jgi:hypothetical protein
VLGFAAGRADWNISEQRHVHVLRNPLLPKDGAPQHDGCSSRPLGRSASLRIVGGVEHGHARRREAVAWDDGAQLVETPPEVADAIPDGASLVCYGGPRPTVNGLKLPNVIMSSVDKAQVPTKSTDRT